MELKNYKKHAKEGLHLAYPVMLSQLGHVTMGVADNIMVGNLGAANLAGAGLANVAFNFLLLFGIGVSYAITPLVSTADGERDDTKIASILKHGLLINLCNSLILVVIVLIGMNVLYHINQPPEVVVLSIPYLSIITFSLIPILVFQTFRQFTEGLSLTRIAMIIVITANVVNIGLNYLLIYGHGGFPALGLNGAGYATLTSRILMAVVFAGYVYLAPRFKKFRNGFSIGNYSKALLNKMLHIGIPAGMQFIFEVAAFDFSLVMMGWLGTQALAAHQIAINLATISYMTTSGLAAAATIRVSHFLGKKDFSNLRQSAYSLLGVALLIMTAWAIFFIVGRNFLPLLYVHDAEVIAIAGPLLVIAGLFQLSDGAQVVCIGALRGLQDVKIPSLLIFISYWIIGLPLGYLLAFVLGWGAIGIWLGLLLGLTLTATAMFLRFKKLAGSLK
ncbi:MAG: MATE family efflux transporter [Flammeovirgaceae bacterium]|jgi:MATE family multidrug resistance protein|nr:MATE family efflux transporter [Flammeovirgaceae bacterium]